MNQLYTKLNNGNTMPLLGLGVYDMYKKEAERAIATALEVGYRLIDTAAMYTNEVEVGNAIRSSSINRSEIFVTTKVNNPDQGYDNTIRAFDKSMQKLNIEYIDLYLVHWPIKGKRKDTWRALEYLYNNKQLRAIGVANYLLPFLHELETYAAVVPAINQVEFSPYLYLKELLNYCKERSIQVQAYTPLTKGQRLKDKRLVQLAEKYKKTPAQITLRWILQHGVSAIPKSSNPMRIKENFDAFNFEISEDDMAMMDTLNEDLRIVGEPMHML